MFTFFFQLKANPMIVFNSGICTYISVLSYMFGYCLFLFNLVTKHEKSNIFLKTSHSIGFLRVNNPNDVLQLIIKFEFSMLPLQMVSVFFFFSLLSNISYSTELLCRIKFVFNGRKKIT